jgi:Tol biopolymer transport system component
VTELPRTFPIPRDASERQRAVLSAHLGAPRRSSRLALRRLAAVAALVLVSALLVTPALGLTGHLLELFESDPGPPGGRTPTWSPDGRKIAFLSRRARGMWDLYVMNADGGGQRRLMQDVRLEGLDWSPDGRNIAVAAPGQGLIGFYAVNTDGSGRRLLVRPGVAPAWSPDGRRIAYAARGIWLVNADGSEPRQLTTQSNGRNTRLYWSPDGRKLAFLSGACGDFCEHLYVINADGSGLRNLTPHLRGGPGRGAADPSWSPDGRTIAFVRRDFRSNAVYVVRPDGGSGRRRLTWAPVDYAAPAWSPDGRRIAFVGTLDGNFEIYVMNADGRRRRNLTLHPGYDGDPTWSPDGRRIAFVSNRDGAYGIYVMSPDGSGLRKLTNRSE